MRRPKVCFVVQRYGEEVVGGAESLCKKIAEKMTRYWDIDVLTSCARNYVKRFENEYSPGKEENKGVSVRRFEIDYFRSDDRVFARLDEKVRQRKCSDSEELLWLKEIGPYSSSLISYVQQNHSRYGRFFFFTYLYATTTLILPEIKTKSYLIPAVHDEPPVYARFFDDFFLLPKGLIFSTEEEMEFLKKRTVGRMSPHFVIGVGLDSPDLSSAEKFRREFGIHGDFILYVGRIQKQKGCDELFDFYLRLPLDLRRRLPLVLIGKSAMDFPDNENIISLGFVSEKIRNSAMAAARLVVMPSRFESLNMVILESWLCKTPVLVNGACEVLREQCRRSNGGLWYKDFYEFEECLKFMLSNVTLLERMGICGKGYVEKQYSWDEIQKKYLEIAQVCSSAP